MVSAYQLQVQMAPEPAALERLCQVIRIRGFELSAFSAERTESGWSIGFTVHGTRPLATLQSQIDKLHCVKTTQVDGR